MQAAGQSQRASIARFFLAELGGENSWRLLFGGMLTDMAVEHYQWVAGGDKGHPDPSTAVEGTAMFMNRLRVLFDEGVILTSPDTYTGEVLKFLQKGKTVVYGRHLQSCGLGPLADAAVQDTAAQALRYAREVVANIRAFLPVYRSESGWLQAFSAFRLPSPLSRAESARQSPAALQRQQTEADRAQAALERLRKTANLGEIAKQQLLQTLLPRAETHSRAGCGTKAAWGRASAEFPELRQGRALVELFLAWKPNTGNLERRFRDLREHNPLARPRLLDLTAEDLLLVDRAPSSKALLAALACGGPPAASADAIANAQAASRTRDYIARVIRAHSDLHGQPNRQAPPARKERRDKGKPRKDEDIARKSGAPVSEAAFARKRAAAVSEAAQASPDERAKRRRQHPLGKVAAAVAAETVAASAAVEEKASRRSEAVAISFREAEAQAQRARGKLERKRDQAFVAGPQDREEGAESAPAGVALAPAGAQEVHAALRKNRFKVTSCPLEFVGEVLRVRGAAPRHGHLALVPRGASTDYAVAARLAAALLGVYMATPEDYMSKGRRCGHQFAPSYKAKGPRWTVAVSAAIAREFPSTPAVLRRVAQAAGSRLTAVRSAGEMEQHFLKQGRKSAAAWKTCRLFSTNSEREQARKELRPLYANEGDFLRFVQALAVGATACPGFV